MALATASVIWSIETGLESQFKVREASVVLFLLGWGAGQGRGEEGKDSILLSPSANGAFESLNWSHVP